MKYRLFESEAYKALLSNCCFLGKMTVTIRLISSIFYVIMYYNVTNENGFRRKLKI